MQKTFLLLVFMVGLTIFAEEPPFYGVCTHVSRKGTDFEQMDGVFRKMNCAGIRWARTDFDWWGGEPRKGQWNYSHLDVLRDKARKEGIRILPILGYTVAWATPAWKHPDAWLAYVRKTVERYKNDFRYWEIYNEPNTPFWKDKISAKAYAELLKKTSREIKAIDPALKVVLGGVSGVPIPYLEELFQAGGADAFDVMNIHPYQWNALPEENLPLYRNLKMMMRKYGADRKPVWITEIGWSTARPPELHARVVKAALERLNIDPGNFPLACVSSVQAVVPPSLSGMFRETVLFRVGEIGALDPHRFPVLIPCLGETFPAGAHEQLENYLRKGGTVLLLQGLPFYYDLLPDGGLKQVNDRHLKRFHLATDTWWTTKGVPKYEKHYRIADEFGRSLRLKKEDFPGNAGRGRFLSSRNLKTGDLFIPMVFGRSGDFEAPVCGIYRLNSDLKGALVVCTLKKNAETVSEQYQAAYLVRSALLAAASGIEAFFCYNLRSREYAPSAREAHFGILHKDLSPKPAYEALRELIRRLPEHSVRPVLTRRENGILLLEWQTRNGRKIYALYSEFSALKCRIASSDPDAVLYDLYGKRIGRAEGEWTLSFAPVYVEGTGTVSVK